MDNLKNTLEKNKLLSIELAVWFFITAFENYIPNSYSISTHVSFVILITHILQDLEARGQRPLRIDNRAVLIIAIIYSIFAIIAGVFWKNYYILEFIYTFTGLLISIAGIAYFYKISDRQVEIQIERIFRVIIAMLSFGIIYGSVQGIKTLLYYVLGISNDFEVFNSLLLAATSTIAMIILFADTGDQKGFHRGIDLIKENETYNLFVRLFSKILAFILILFNAIGVLQLPDL